MSQITLRFSDHGTPALDGVEFSHPLLARPRVSRRGKGFSSELCRYTFQWSPAVRAMSILFLWTKSNYIIRSTWPEPSVAALSGGAGSYAASLDYALSKKPLWLLDMFGVNSEGDPLARGLFMRWNSERKRGGEVTVAFNPRQLSAENIGVMVNGESIDDPGSCISLAAVIEQSIGAIGAGADGFPLSKRGPILEREA